VGGESIGRRRRLTLRTDGKILADFAASRSEDAFAELIQRHGGLVYATCQRILGCSGLADDAFQATFMVLGRKAARLARRKSVAGWLALTAANVARRTKKAESRRRAREEEAWRMREQIVKSEKDSGELSFKLDAALKSLPGPQREAVLLHHMEGRTLSEVALLTDVTERTAKWRAADGLDRLRSRLSRAGGALGGTALAAFLSAEGQAMPPAALTASLPGAVAGFAGSGIVGGVAASAGKLTEEVLKAMFWIKIKIGAAILLAACVTGVSIPVVNKLVRAAEVPEAGADAKPKPKPLVAPAGKIRKVAFLKSGHTQNLLPSPDGSNLAIVQTIHMKHEGKSGPWWHLMVVDAASGKSTLLEKTWGMPPAGQPTGAQHLKTSLAWAPDSSKFLLANAMSGTCRVKVFDKQGKKLAGFSAGSLKGDHLRLIILPSPDGSKVVFFSRGHAGDTALAIYKKKKKKVARQKIPGTGICYAAWLPDSKSLNVVPWRGVKNPNNNRISQWRSEGVYSVPVDGGKVTPFKGTLREDKVFIGGLSSNGQNVVLLSGNIFKKNLKWKIHNLASGKSVELKRAALGFVHGKMPGRTWSPPGKPGFMILSCGDQVLRYVTPDGKINKMANGFKVATWRGGGLAKTGGDLFAFNRVADLYVTSISVPGPARKVGANWLRKHFSKKRPKAPPQYWRKSMYDQVVFSSDGKHLFGTLNLLNKGTTIIEFPINR